MQKLCESFSSFFFHQKTCFLPHFIKHSVKTSQHISNVAECFRIWHVHVTSDTCASHHVASRRITSPSLSWQYSRSRRSAIQCSKRSAVGTSRRCFERNKINTSNTKCRSQHFVNTSSTSQHYVFENVGVQNVLRKFVNFQNFSKSHQAFHLSSDSTGQGGDESSILWGKEQENRTPPPYVKVSRDTWFQPPIPCWSKSPLFLAEARATSARWC